MSTLDEITKEKQRLGAALARVDAQREKLTVFELHTLLHAGPRTNTLAPGLQMLQTGTVGERLAAGINWVDRQIRGGDFVADYNGVLASCSSAKRHRLTKRPS